MAIKKETKFIALIFNTFIKYYISFFSWYQNNFFFRLNFYILLIIVYLYYSALKDMI